MKTKPKTKLMIAVASFLLLSVYTCWYFHQRFTHEIIHYKTWSDRNYHRVEASGPDGPALFAAAMFSGRFEELEERLDAAYRQNQKDVRFRQIVSWPLRNLELAWWNLTDRNRN